MNVLGVIIYFELSSHSHAYAHCRASGLSWLDGFFSAGPFFVDIKFFAKPQNS